MPSWSRQDDERFSELLRELAERHADAARFRAVATEADALLGEGLHLGDEVRRAVRRREAARPSAADCERLQQSVDRLRALQERATADPRVAALIAAYDRADASQCAALACQIFVGLSVATEQSGAAYLPFALRRRSARGESVLHPERVAAAIDDWFGAGLRPQEGEPDATQPMRLPEPLKLVRRFVNCDSEAAIEVEIERIAGPILAYEPTGDLWVFARRIDTPRVVALSPQAEDEWWTASPVPYPAYVIALREALAARAIRVAPPEPAGRD